MDWKEERVLVKKVYERVKKHKNMEEGRPHI